MYSVVQLGQTSVASPKGKAFYHHLLDKIIQVSEAEGKDHQRYNNELMFIQCQPYTSVILFFKFYKYQTDKTNIRFTS